MKHRLSLFATIIAGLVTLTLTACGATPNATDWVFGESLMIRVKEVRLAEDVSYSFDGKHYRIQPGQDGRTLAAASLEVRTHGANVTYFSVSKDTVRLRDDTYLDYRSIDPFQERSEVAEASPGEDTVTPFIWGDVELRASCGGLEFCELNGWVLFEVPRDIKLFQLIWDTGDSIYLRF